MNFPLRDACALNNMGVTMMLKGHDYESASGLFQDSLFILKQTLQIQESRSRTELEEQGRSHRSFCQDRLRKASICVVQKTSSSRTSRKQPGPSNVYLETSSSKMPFNCSPLRLSAPLSYIAETESNDLASFLNILSSRVNVLPVVMIRKTSQMVSMASDEALGRGEQVNRGLESEESNEEGGEVESGIILYNYGIAQYKTLFCSPTGEEQVTAGNSLALIGAQMNCPKQAKKAYMFFVLAHAAFLKRKALIPNNELEDCLLITILALFALRGARQVLMLYPTAFITEREINRGTNNCRQAAQQLQGIENAIMQLEQEISWYLESPIFMSLDSRNHHTNNTAVKNIMTGKESIHVTPYHSDFAVMA